MGRPFWMRNWMRLFFERRRFERRWVSGISAVYWDGGVNHPWPICEISMGGAVLETPDDWLGGTLVHLVLEHRNGASSGTRGGTCSVWARVVRRGFQGVCVEFMPGDRTEAEKLRRFVRAAESMPALDERTLEKELQ